MATITTTYHGDMLFETQVGRHRLLTDVPESMGGQDRGLMPPQLFIASLGSCVAALIADYCEHHQLDDTDLSVDVDFEKVDGPTRLSDIRVRVHLPYVALDDRRREATLARVAELCPVHMTIETVKEIDFDILGADELKPA